MTATTFAHCFGVRFRAAMPPLGEANTAWPASQSAAAMEEMGRMTVREGLGLRMQYPYCAKYEMEGK